VLLKILTLTSAKPVFKCIIRTDHMPIQLGVGPEPIPGPKHLYSSETKNVYFHH